MVGAELLPRKPAMKTDGLGTLVPASRLVCVVDSLHTYIHVHDDVYKL